MDGKLSRRLLSAILLLAGIIHLLPVIGAFGADRLAALYGTVVAEPNLEILLRHRAVLFGILGVLLTAAAFRSSLVPTAMAAGFASVGSFLVIALTPGGYNEAIGRVILIDLVVLLCLFAGVVLRRFDQAESVSS